jgi:hypothetical protein
MEHALRFVDGQGVRTVRLDATPMGQPLYEKLGFAVEYSLVRYEGRLQAAVDYPFEEKASAVSTAQPDEWEAMMALDQAVCATDRRKLLQRLFAERPESVRVVRRGGQVAGYLTVRPGELALQVGPCMASAQAGPLLLADAWQRYASQRVFLDVPTDNKVAVAFAEQMGLKVQRPLTRMGRGPRVNEDFQRLWASFGPELG